MGMIDFACKNFKLEEVIKCGLGLTKGDYEVLSYLINNQEWMESADVSKSLKMNLSTAQRALKKLFEAGVVIRSQKNLEGGGYAYFYRSKKPKKMKEIIMVVINKWVSKVEYEFDRWK